MTSRTTWRVTSFLAGLSCGLLFFCGQGLRAEDVSPPAILQWFEASYKTMERRTPDVFMAGYGGVWIPPVGRAGSRGNGDNSVGYDPYDRFDLGTEDKPTHYGTESGLKRAADQFHRAVVDLYIDFVINHNGFNDANAKDGAVSFIDAGDYPGFVPKLQNDLNGDFHPNDAQGEIDGRAPGHGIDIAHEKDHRFVRNPVPGIANNLPAGTKVAFERIADVPSEENRRFYPDRNLPPIFLFNPKTGEQGIQVFPFNLNDPKQGDPIEENTMGYLMRNAQWLVQVIGADGFRIDAAKHVRQEALHNLDRAVYRANPRNYLDGSTKHVFCFGETKDRKIDILKRFVEKSINPSDPGRIGGNRDTLDFAFFDNVKENLTGNGLANDWGKVKQASLDFHDDGLQNGSAGVKFVSSHDDGGPHLSNVAHAYMLMLPGNTIVYHNAKEFGETGNFPQDGRGDALGGLFGNRVTRLLSIRNSHGRGNYHERLSEKELFAFEREGSAVVLLSNRLDAGFDSRTLNVSFEPGTRLVELTGNASDPSIDPNDDIPELIEVNADHTINVRFPRNVASGGTAHNSGYLIYGLAPPQAPLGIELTGVDRVIAGDIPTSSTNGTTRLTDLHVIKGDSFQIKMKFVQVNLLGSIRDAFADGDNALFRIDAGVDGNGNGQVDFRTPGTVSYGFEKFLEKSSPLIGSGSSRGDGEFIQTVDATKLEPGIHFIEVRAFRHRPGGGPVIYSSFKKMIMIERT
jgi:alpha-amylase